MLNGRKINHCLQSCFLLSARETWSCMCVTTVAHSVIAPDFFTFLVVADCQIISTKAIHLSQLAPEQNTVVMNRQTD